MTARSYLAWLMWLLGYPDQAAEHNRESLKLARETDHALSLGHALYFAAVHAHLRQDWAALRELADELVFMSQERKLTFWLPAGRVFSGLLMTRAGGGLTGIDQMLSGIDALRAVNTSLCLTVNYLFLAEAYSQSGQTTEALTAIQAALSLVERTRERSFAAELHRLQGELLLRQENHGAETKAEECFRRAVEIAQQQSAKSWELRAGTSLSRLWLRHGKKADAFELLAPVCDWFTEGRDTADLKESRTLLDQLR